MSDPVSFLTAADEVEIKQLIRDASATMQGLQDPAAIVTFTRDDTTVAENVELVYIGVDERDQVTAGQGAIEETTRGTAIAWEGDITALKQGDYFRWGDRPCVLTSPPLPPEYGTVELRFRLLGGRRP